MSTTPVAAPSTPAAPPVAAPTPAAAPTSVASPTPAPAVPATPAIQPPNPADYSGDRFAEFRQARREYEAKTAAESTPAAEAYPKTAVEAEAAVAAAAQPEAAKAEEAAPADESLEADPDANPLEEPASITPQGLSEMLTSNKALQEALAADPKARGALFKMARENAELAPFREVFPDVESAKFAASTASEFVSLRAKFETAATPEDMNGAFESFVDQFKVVDEKGQPIFENGKPKLGDDYYAFADTFKGRLFSGALDEIEQRLTANQYATPEAREADENRKLAYEFLMSDKGADQNTSPDLSGLPADVRTRIEQREADLKAREDKLNGKDKAQTEQQKAQAKAEHYQKFNQEIGTRIKGVFDSTVKSLRDVGVYIPSYLLDSPDGKTAPQFVARVINEFKQITGKDAKILSDRVALERLPATEQNRQRRVDFEDKLYQRMLPGLIKSELRSVSAKLKADLDAQNKPPSSANVSSEPKAAGAAPTPTAWTQESSIEQAKKNVAERTKGAFVDAGERNAMILAEARRLRSQR